MRHADWPERLEATLCLWRYRPFTWGLYDCAHFARDCLAAIDTRDWQALMLPSYQDKASAQRCLKRFGVRHMPQLLSQLLGSLRRGFPMRGDLVAIPTAEGRAIGACIGNSIAAVGIEGLVFIKVTQNSLYWRV